MDVCFTSYSWNNRFGGDSWAVGSIEEDERPKGWIWEQFNSMELLLLEDWNGSLLWNSPVDCLRSTVGLLGGLAASILTRRGPTTFNGKTKSYLRIGKKSFEEWCCQSRDSVGPWGHSRLPNLIWKMNKIYRLPGIPNIRKAPRIGLSIFRGIEKNARFTYSHCVCYYMGSRLYLWGGIWKNVCFFRPSVWGWVWGSVLPECIGGISGFNHFIL